MFMDMKHAMHLRGIESLSVRSVTEGTVSVKSVSMQGWRLRVIDIVFDLESCVFMRMKWVCLPLNYYNTSDVLPTRTFRFL